MTTVSSKIELADFQLRQQLHLTKIANTQNLLFLDKTDSTPLGSFHVDLESYSLRVPLLAPRTLKGFHFAVNSPVVLVKVASAALLLNLLLQ